MTRKPKPKVDKESAELNRPWPILGSKSAFRKWLLEFAKAKARTTHNPAVDARAGDAEWDRAVGKLVRMASNDNPRWALKKNFELGRELTPKEQQRIYRGLRKKPKEGRRDLWLRDYLWYRYVESCHELGMKKKDAVAQLHKRIAARDNLTIKTVQNAVNRGRTIARSRPPGN